MATQQADTFGTGGRGASNGAGTLTQGQTVTAWSPASNGNNWIAQSAPSAFAFSGTAGSTTGANTANVVTLSSDSKQWYSSIVQAEFTKTGATDDCAVMCRFTDTSNHYRAEVVSNNLNIIKLVGGNSTTLATIPFTDGGAAFKIKFLCQGFGQNGAVQNLQAKAWLSSGSEPANYQIAASDAALTNPGYVGVRMKGGTNGTTQTVDNFSAVDPAQLTPAPTYNTVFDLPYGMTLFEGPNNAPTLGNNAPILSQQTITDLQGWGNGAVLRLQLQWQDIELQSGFYQWDVLDDFVYRCNQAGIRLWWVCQSAPSFRLTRDGYGSNTTLQAALTAATPVTSINVAALPAGAFIPHGAQLKIDSGGVNPETVTINNPGNTYKAGATQLTINSFTPSFNHSVGAQIYEATAGAVLPSPSDFATFVALAAARYNGQNGYGKIEMIQVLNEECDAQTRVGNQSTGSWDNGGGILAPIYVAGYNAIKAVYPACRVVAGAVRNAPLTSLAHIIAWLKAFCSYVQSVGGQIDDLDAHYYHDGVQDWNGTPVASPTQNTYTDGTLTVVNRPSIGLELSTMRQVGLQYGFDPELNIGEFGWLVYDDSSGFSPTTSATLTAGTTYTSISVAALAQGIPDATPIFIDTGGTHPEGPVYAWGQAASSATVIQITTNPAGHAQMQVGFTPAFTHTSPVNLYAALGGIAQSQTQDMIYSQAMYDAGRQVGASHILRFTMVPNSTVSVATIPQKVTGSTGAPRSWTQSMSGVYTYMPGYYMTKLYASQFATRFWTQPAQRSLPLVADAGSLPLVASNGALPLTANVP